MILFLIVVHILILCPCTKLGQSPLVFLHYLLHAWSLGRDAGWVSRVREQKYVRADDDAIILSQRNAVTGLKHFTVMKRHAIFSEEGNRILQDFYCTVLQEIMLIMAH